MLHKIILRKGIQKKKKQINKQLYLFTLHCELKPYAALKGVSLLMGPRGMEGLIDADVDRFYTWCRERLPGGSY